MVLGLMVDAVVVLVTIAVTAVAGEFELQPHSPLLDWLWKKWLSDSCFPSHPLSLIG